MWQNDRKEKAVLGGITMDKLTKITETIKELEHIERIILGEKNENTVKTAISLLSDYAKWYDYKTPQRELYELKERERKEYGNISL